MLEGIILAQIYTLILAQNGGLSTFKKIFHPHAKTFLKVIILAAKMCKIYKMAPLRQSLAQGFTFNFSDIIL